jgi:hypothetical protein
MNSTRRAAIAPTVTAPTLASTGASLADAQSIPAYCLLQNLATGLVLDSNEGRAVYTNQGNGGLFQQWVASPSEDDEDIVTLRNLATSLVLDSNADRAVYANDFNGGEFQQWAINRPEDDESIVTLQNVATGLYLDSNAAQAVYTHDGNDGPFQRWVIQAL